MTAAVHSFCGAEGGHKVSSKDAQHVFILNPHTINLNLSHKIYTEYLPFFSGETKFITHRLYASWDNILMNYLNVQS